MSNATAARSAPPMAASERRLAAGVLASLLLHALVLSLQFGIPGLRPGLGGPVTIRLAPAPSLPPMPAAPEGVSIVPAASVAGAAPIPMVPAPAPVPSARDTAPVASVLSAPVVVPTQHAFSVPATPVRPGTTQPGFTLVDPVAPLPVSAPRPEPAAPPPRRVVRHRRNVSISHVADGLHTPVIARDKPSNDSFEVPQPVVETDPDPAPLARTETPADDDVATEQATHNERARLAEAREREQAMKREADDARLHAEAEQTLQTEAAQQRQRLAAQMARHDDELAARQRDADAARASAEQRVADEEARLRAEQQRVQQAELERARRATEAQRVQQAEQQRLEQAEQVRVQRLTEQERLRQAEEARAQQLAKQQRLEQAEQDRRQQLVEQARLKQAEQERAQQLAEQQRVEQAEREQAQRLEAERLQQAERERAQQLAEQQRRQQAEQERAQQLADQRRAEEARRQLADERFRQERAQQAEQAARREAEERARLAQEQARRQRDHDAPGAAPGPASGPASGIADGAPGDGAGQRGDRRPHAAPGSALASRAREMLRGIDILKPVPQAVRPAEDMARRAPAEAGRRDIPLRMYTDSVRQKIERNAVLSDAQLSADVVRTDPIVSVAIRSDGSVEDVTIVRSSGRTDIDEFVRRIVHLNARYAAFPPNVAAHYDVIELRRVWRFAGALRLLEEVR